jgi:hypothetical protein
MLPEHLSGGWGVMKSLLVSPLLLSCYMLLQSQVVTLGVGEIALPGGFAHKTVGVTDSSMGAIKKSDGALVISYDIGPMAGTHMHPGRRKECRWFREQVIDGRQVYLGLVEKNGQRELIVTVMTDGVSEPLALPANFRAAVRGRRDVADVMRVAAGYKPRRKS